MKIKGNRLNIVSKLKYFLTVSATLLVVGVILLFAVGFNTGLSLGGGSEIEITMTETSNKNEYTKAVKKVFKKHGMSIREVMVEDKMYQIDLVVRSTSEVSSAKAAAIRTDIITELAIDESAVSALSRVDATFSTKAISYTALVISVVFIATFLFGLLKYKWFGGLTLVLVMLHYFVINLCLMLITRIELNISTLTVMVGFTVFSLITATLLIERANAIYNHQVEKKIDISTATNMAIKESIKPVLITSLIVAVFFVVCLFTFVTDFVFVGLAGIVSIIMMLYSSVGIGSAFYSQLALKLIEKEKQQLTKNIQQAPPPKTKNKTKRKIKVK